MKTRYISLEPLIDWRRSERPLNLHFSFSTTRPLILEIGFGNGEYLANRALQNPGVNYVGLEKEWQSVWRALRRIARLKLDNVRIIKADARWAVFRLFEPLCFKEIYSLFPCPWPKEKHEKHRLFGNRFLKRLNNCLERGGLLWIVTDDFHYAEWVMNQTEDTGFKVLLEKVPPENFLTKYGKKWIDEGKTFFYRLTLKKESHCYENAITYREMKTYYIEKFEPRRFKPYPVRNDVVVDFKDYIFDPDQNRALLRAVVVEDNFVQDFWIEIRKKENRWHIRPASGCGWIPTMGLQRALDAVYEACKIK